MEDVGTIQANRPSYLNGQLGYPGTASAKRLGRTELQIRDLVKVNSKVLGKLGINLGNADT